MFSPTALAQKTKNEALADLWMNPKCEPRQTPNGRWINTQLTIENENLGQEKRIAADPIHRQTKQSNFFGRLLTSGFLG